MTRMRRAQIASLGTLAVLAATLSLSAELAAGQGGQLVASKAAGARAETPLRMPWGDPDLQGIWTNSTLTPFERFDLVRRFMSTTARLERCFCTLQGEN